MRTAHPVARLLLICCWLSPLNQFSFNYSLSEMKSIIVLLATSFATAVAQAKVPTFALYNSAQPGMTIPAVGLGTGMYLHASFIS